jgi:hypothetical protein
MDELLIRIELDLLHIQLEEHAKNLDDKRAPIERMVDEACGINHNTLLEEKMREILKVVARINRLKKKIGIDTATSEKRWREMKKKLQVLTRGLNESSCAKNG